MILKETCMYTFSSSFEGSAGLKPSRTNISKLGVISFFAYTASLFALYAPWSSYYNESGEKKGTVTETLFTFGNDEKGITLLKAQTMESLGLLVFLCSILATSLQLEGSIGDFKRPHFGQAILFFATLLIEFFTTIILWTRFEKHFIEFSGSDTSTREVGFWAMVFVSMHSVLLLVVYGFLYTRDGMRKYKTTTLKDYDEYVPDSKPTPFTSVKSHTRAINLPGISAFMAYTASAFTLFAPWSSNHNLNTGMIVTKTLFTLKNDINGDEKFLGIANTMPAMGWTVFVITCIMLYAQTIGRREYRRNTPPGEKLLFAALLFTQFGLILAMISRFEIHFERFTGSEESLRGIGFWAAICVGVHSAFNFVVYGGEYTIDILDHCLIRCASGARNIYHRV